MHLQHTKHTGHAGNIQEYRYVFILLTDSNFDAVHIHTRGLSSPYLTSAAEPAPTFKMLQYIKSHEGTAPSIQYMAQNTNNKRERQHDLSMRSGFNGFNSSTAEK